MSFVTPVNHPEFPPRITSKIVDAVYRRLDIKLFRDFFVGGLGKTEVEDLFLLETFDPPALGVILGAIDNAPLPSSEELQTTAVQLEIVWPLPRRRDTRDNLRARVIDEIRRTLRDDFGQLRDEEGILLTEALARFRRLNPPLAVPRANPQYMLDRFEVLYVSRVGPDMELVG